MIPVVIGVDPGLTGALSLLVDGRLVDVVDMPTAMGAGTKSNRVQPVALRDVIEDWGLQFQEPPHQWVAVIEQVAAMPKQGVSSVFSLGHSLGAVEAVLSAARLRVEWAPPGKWKRDMGLATQRPPGSPTPSTAERAAAKRLAKGAARALASRLFPAHSDRWKLVKHDGRAESVLIAHWWHTRR